MSTKHKRSCRCGECRALRDAQRKLYRQFFETAGLAWETLGDTEPERGETAQQFVTMFSLGIQPFGPKQLDLLRREPERWNILAKLAGQIVGD